jgi:hypothetical protein
MLLAMSARRAASRGFGSRSEVRDRRDIFFAGEAWRIELEVLFKTI